MSLYLLIGVYLHSINPISIDLRLKGLRGNLEILSRQYITTRGKRASSSRSQAFFGVGLAGLFKGLFILKYDVYKIVDREGGANFRLNFAIQAMVKYPRVLVHHEWISGNHWGLDSVHLDDVLI